jgi:hypothetical protein
MTVNCTFVVSRFNNKRHGLPSDSQSGAVCIVALIDRIAELG